MWRGVFQAHDDGLEGAHSGRVFFFSQSGRLPRLNHLPDDSEDGKKPVILSLALGVGQQVPPELGEARHGLIILCPACRQLQGGADRDDRHQWHLRPPQRLDVTRTIYRWAHYYERYSAQLLCGIDSSCFKHDKRPSRVLTFGERPPFLAAGLWPELAENGPAAMARADEVSCLHEARSAHPDPRLSVIGSV